MIDASQGSHRCHGLRLVLASAHLEQQRQRLPADLAEGHHSGDRHHGGIVMQRGLKGCHGFRRNIDAGPIGSNLGIGLHATGANGGIEAGVELSGKGQHRPIGEST